MALFNVAAPVNALNPVRTLAWNATMRAGDDIKVAFTLLDDDCETPINVRSANAQLSLYHMDEGRGRWDYGISHGGWCDGPYGHAAAIVPGVVQNDAVEGRGRINFFLPASLSVGLWEGRYRAFIAVDQPYGVSTEIEGMIQVRANAKNTLGNAPREYLRIGISRLGEALIPPQVIAGLPSDADGFPLRQLIPVPPIVPVIPSASTAVLGQCVLGQMVLGSGGGQSQAVMPLSSTTALVGQCVVGQIILGSSGTPTGSTTAPGGSIGMGIF
jgi:hypothetical protein